MLLINLPILPSALSPHNLSLRDCFYFCAFLYHLFPNDFQTYIYISQFFPSVRLTISKSKSNSVCIKLNSLFFPRTATCSNFPIFVNGTILLSSSQYLHLGTTLIYFLSNSLFEYPIHPRLYTHWTHTEISHGVPNSYSSLLCTFLWVDLIESILSSYPTCTIPYQIVWHRCKSMDFGDGLLEFKLQLCNISAISPLANDGIIKWVNILKAFRKMPSIQ